MGTVGLAKALAMLRDQLSLAQDEGAGHQFRFEITEAEVEFLVEVDAEGGGEAGGNIGVVAVKAGGKVSRADTHRLRLKLLVKDAAIGGRNLEVNRGQARSWEE
jgi:Trypsin-co-occurring domain 2